MIYIPKFSTTLVTYTTSISEEDLQGILKLQKANLSAQLTQDEMESQGFVTVVHSLDELSQMNTIEPHVIAKDDHKVIAYLLAMTAASKNDIDILKPMFQMFDDVQFEGEPVGAYNYIVVGQVCIDKHYRGQGILDGCYAFYKDIFHLKYNFAITEIATRNSRSLRAHKRIGFEELHRYSVPGCDEWTIVLWKW